MSRCLRLRFPEATTVAVDSSLDTLTGMVDATFSRSLSVDVVMEPSLSKKEKKQHWTLISKILLEDSKAMYLPCSDNEIDRIAENLYSSPEEVQAALGVGSAARILCPPPEAVKATEKPDIAGAAAMAGGIFKIPPYMTLEADKRSQTDVEDWCKVHGYPVLVKGPVQGATVCPNWASVLAAVSSCWGSGGYVQKIAVGFQFGLASK